MSYREHPSKVVRLNESGEIAAYPPAEDADCTVWVAIPDATEEWEGILGRRTGSDRVRLVGIPLFVYDLNHGDEVRFIESAERSRSQPASSPTQATTRSALCSTVQ